MWPLLSTSLHFLFLILLRDFPLSNSLLLPNRCNETCGNTVIPFPFHLNSSCPTSAAATSSPPDAFRLTCAKNATLFLTIGDHSSSSDTGLAIRVVEFYSDGLLLDVSSRRRYEDLNSFEVGREARRFFGVSEDNVVGLYDCEDTSVCRAECEGGGGGGSPECCYPLSDHSVWRVGDAGFSGFGRFGCRGFSSWAGPARRPGLKLEWAVPRNLTLRPGGGVCHGNASVVNATAVSGGVRCLCPQGFVGDGFLMGNGCVISCIKDRREVYGSECNQQNHINNDKKFVIIAGVLSSAFIVASLAALFFLLKQPEEGKSGEPGFDYTTTNHRFNFPGDVDEASLRKACRARLFSRGELEQATQGFQQSSHCQLAKGVLPEGTLVAVQTVRCRSETDLIQVLSRVDALSPVLLHRHLATVLGCCLDDPAAPIVVYERPPNGTLEDRLPSLDWPRRLRVATEVAAALAFLHHETDPPMPHRGLVPASVFLDDDFSAKLAGFGLAGDDKKSDVWEVGMMLAEMVAGRGCHAAALQRMRSYGRVAVEEVVDPGLYFHEMPGSRRDQVQSVADLAARCLMFDRHGSIRMADVARELVRISGGVAVDGGVGCSGSKRGQGLLEETFSNSSLLQMISMSPDSVYLP